MALRYIKLFLDWPEITQELTLEEKGRLIEAMIAYARGDPVDLAGNERFVFPAFRSQLDRDAEGYASIVNRNQSNGRKGGRPKKVETQNNPENPVGYLETQKSQDKDKDKDKDNIESGAKAPQEKRKRFFPPTLDEVRNEMQSYCAEKRLSRDAATEAERFIDYYASNGWKVGKNAMKDWRAAARGWLRRSSAQSSGGTPSANTQFSGRDVADLDSLYG